MKRWYLGMLAFAAILPAYAQETPATRGRGSAATAPATPATTSLGTTPIPIAPFMDESQAVSHHEIALGNTTLKYTATTAEMPIKDLNGDTEAHMFYVAYTLDGADKAKRPVTFAFNGGPGSASMWVHIGAMGPRSPVLKDNGDMPQPPFKLKDNPNTWLDQTDLVFIDAVGTGFSRPKSVEVARRINGVQGDIASFTEFVRNYITQNDRWGSPLFIAGESYGTFRAAGLAGSLQDQGIAVNGVTLISTILNYGTSRGTLMNSYPYALALPTFTADAYYHKKLPADLQKDLKTTLKEVEDWAMGPYMQALNKGDTIPADERKAAVEKLARYTGLSTTYCDNINLRLDTGHVTRELLRDQKLIVGRLDGRLTGPAPMNVSETADYDPSSTLTQPPFEAAFMQYTRGELNFKTDMKYYVSGGIMPWDYGADNSTADTTAALRNAFTKNPHLKVMVCCGYYDLATPYFAAQYTLNHMGIHPEQQKQISWKYYEAGHMMYIDAPSHAKLKTDITEFIKSAMPQ
jgi:carboxypeptidase C (cathepsin A)